MITSVTLRRNAGKWEAVVRTHGDPKYKREYVHTLDSLAAARNELGKMCREIDDGQPVTDVDSGLDQ